MTTKAPWYPTYQELGIPEHLDYPDMSMFQLIESNAKAYPDGIAYEFENTKVTFREFIGKVHTCAKALRALGIKPDDRVTICMPNAPQGIIMFYALNLMGAIPNMVHPLSSEGEIEFYLTFSHSKAVLVLDLFYAKVAAVRSNAPELEHVIVADIATELKGVLKTGYKLTSGRKINKKNRGVSAEGTISWTDFISGADSWTGEYMYARRGADPGAILYSGGTTGTTKGILLSNLNFNALALQLSAFVPGVLPGQKMLSIMPIFHGFGLGVGIHSMLVLGVTCHLVPRFSVETYAKLLKKVQPNYIAGVPTLYEALLRSDKMQGVNLACLKGVFSGGDSLSVELKRKVDRFLKDHNATIEVQEGFGLTECVTASCLTPRGHYKEGSIGIPFPDTYYKIVKPSTKVEEPYGHEGEICIAGPSVMIEYIDNAEETASTLQWHEDGKRWLHTGDLGMQDAEGFIYFRQRIKRMIVSSGYNIYPSQLENIIDGNEHVLMSTVVGVPDPYKVQKVKAYIVLKKGVQPTPEVKADIEEHCRKNIAHYALPYEYEYRDSLPQTLVGKVAFTVLEKEALDEVSASPEQDPDAKKAGKQPKAPKEDNPAKEAKPQKGGKKKKAAEKNSTEGE